MLHRARPFYSKLLVLACSCSLLFSSEIAFAQSGDAANAPAAQPGHSMHAHAFNEGPRNAAYLMPGMGNVHWEISTKNPMAQRFFDQGLSQLHGFWYFEAERSFRQAAAFDPNCAMLYWGMARANIENEVRSKGFIEQAMGKLSEASEMEVQLIEAWNRRVENASSEKKPDSFSSVLTSQERKARNRVQQREEAKRESDRKEHLKRYASDLEQILLEHPDDIELKAMLVLQTWQNSSHGIEIQSHMAMNALLDDIFRANPLHPAHHFRIHLWDYVKDTLAIDAAAKCGPSAPGIAHMWHMPGHTYSKLHRYADAAWQQEASARVDHAHMIRDRVMPDQIHNFAHNNEWLIRNLSLLGRVEQALNLAKNMIELPRHPAYNRLEGGGSAADGRERLLQVLVNYQCWATLLELVQSGYLEPTKDKLKDHERSAWMAIAYSQTDRAAEALKIRETLNAAKDEIRSHFYQKKEELQKLLDQESPGEPKPQRPPTLTEPLPLSEDPFGDPNDPSLLQVPDQDIDAIASESWSEARVELASQVQELHHHYAKLVQMLRAIDSYIAAAQGRFKEALSQSHHARQFVPTLTRIEWLFQAGYPDRAMERIHQLLQEDENAFLPLAYSIWFSSQMPDLAPAKMAEVHRRIQSLSAIAAHADPNLNELKRITPYVEKLGLGETWCKPVLPPTDIGDRPALDSLGPMCWTPAAAPIWTAIDAQGQTRSSKQYSGRPTVVLFYLGFGCIHCAEQLKAFAPKSVEFQAAGLDVVAISTETVEQLQEGLKNYGQEIPFPLLANPNKDIFQTFRCFDDFEGQPLHGTFVVDSKGKIRWQDIGHEPFMDVDFLLDEATRLLNL